jgi:hypothetical protein
MPLPHLLLSVSEELEEWGFAHWHKLLQANPAAQCALFSHCSNGSKIPLPQRENDETEDEEKTLELLELSVCPVEEAS